MRQAVTVRSSEQLRARQRKRRARAHEAFTAAVRALLVMRPGA
ncbi:hypothetical protein ACIRU3_39980 [Streptomyces sp. NPDC101151]